MTVIGIDLSGPANFAGTALVCLEQSGRCLRLLDSHLHLGADDHAIFDVVSELAKTDDVIVGLDAPLSYNIGGGDRPADSRLRQKVIAAGLPPGTVMVPTMVRMVYLTLRGIAIARCIDAVDGSVVKVVEVHPTACLILRGAPLNHVRAMKQDVDVRMSLLRWLESAGLEGVSQIPGPTDHYVAACAGALSAWKWSLDECVWLERAQPPFHPYDFAC